MLIYSFKPNLTICCFEFVRMRSLLGMWECDSEALLQAVRCFGVCGGAIAFTECFQLI
ncbi:hypothetical protein IQ226_04615 [Dolichospermum sp. LEGE 00240]|uniref:hypothetical protein n=1 Tax=Dolichospermum sp. LEGE 00240 TaxID=1828603 RepID=UPI00188067E1|nr:hypothetical protein [Dolichospermum sp. LEGE 00240]MBE9248484.1 hypothetical protein [Dolichospermum sp. LEGE 00240]MDM3844458.1 hypothetical protein [Aphanizomenon gracile PMC638.10]MDM3851966.1 hypothetical protein [Aphanizomenon gracile PMC627.10]